MNCPKIVSPSLAIAVAVAFGCFALCLVPCCLAAAAIDTEGLPQELLVPFNDLLPPLSDAEFQEAQTITTKTTTTTASPSVTEAPVSKTTITKAPTKVTTAKPTKSAQTAQKLKKTQYQLDQQLQKQQLVLPILDLNPEVPPALPEAETTVASSATEAPVTTKAVVVPTTPTTPTTRLTPTATKAPFKVSEPKQAASTQHFQQVQAAQTQYHQLQQHLKPQKQQQTHKQQFAKQAVRALEPQAQNRLQPQVVAARTKVTAPPPQRNAPAARQVNVEQLRQYIEYIYQPTTRRPARGPLPTLTPFPRHFK